MLAVAAIYPVEVDTRPPLWWACKHFDLRVIAPYYLMYRR